MDKKVIKSCDDLLRIDRNDSIVIENDIDFEGKNISKILFEFRGEIEGNCHTISNFTVKDTIWGDDQRIALFTHLRNAKIQNLFFLDVTFDIDRSVYTPIVAGLAIDAMESVIRNVKMNVSLTEIKDIPMIYEVNACDLSEVEMRCNNSVVKVLKFKEGHNYEA